MKILFLRQKKILNLMPNFYDEINLFGQWLNKLSIPYEFDHKDFEEEIEWQNYGNAFYAPAQDWFVKMANKYEMPGEYQVLYFLYSPDVDKSAGVFTTHYWRDFNGSICVAIPLTETDVARQDQWLWRVLAHEAIHAMFGILNVIWNKNIPDIQDASYAELRKIKSNPTEDDYTCLSESIFNNYIKPYKDLLSKPSPLNQKANLLLQIIGLLTTLITLLKQKLQQSQEDKKQKVIRKLASAIALSEGYWVRGSLPQRLNNPGALIYVGQDNSIKDSSGFAHFTTPEAGWNALKWQLNFILDGKSKYYSPEMTIQQFVDKWASTSPVNERVAYAQRIAGVFSVDTNTKLKDLVNKV